MNNYVVFSGEDYYPSGGREDFKGSFDTLEEAITAASAIDPKFEWSHVVRMSDGKVVS